VISHSEAATIRRMNIDNREFIARHHKTAGAGQEQAKPAKPGNDALMVMFILLLYGGIFLLCITLISLDQITLTIAGFSIFLAALSSVLGFRAFRLLRKQGSKLALMEEVLEGSRGARLITDGADNMLYCNGRFEKLCRGVGPVGYQSLMKLFQDSEEALAHFRLLADQAHRGLTDSIELFTNYEDRDRWLQITAQPIAGRAGHVHWRIDDVTQSHQIEGAMREEREKLIDFTDNAPVAFFSVDENGRFVFANATFARWLGEDLKSLLGHGLLHTYLVEPPEGAKPYELIADGPAKQIVEMPMKGAAGQTFLASINQVIVHEDGERVRTRAVVHDLTTEREMHQALKASEDRFQRFFEEAPVGIILVDGQGVIEDSNAEFASMLEREITAIEGKPFAEIVEEEQRATVKGALERIETGKPLDKPLEVNILGQNGPVATQMYGRRFKGSESTVLHFIDLTEQKELEQQFVQSQKMQAVGQLAGGIAHDFNNLLTAIIGFCDLLFLRHKPGDPSFGDIMQIKQNSNRAANLVRQLLAFSRQQTLRQKVQDVTDILTELSHLIRRLIGANIELNIIHGEELGLVKVDEGQMEQVLINLAVNARDAIDEASESGGTLTIETSNYTNRKAQELISEEMPPGHWTLIKVSDTGCGIARDNLSRIFEPFFTTKEVGQGTGLGLATVYGIIRQSGGYLDVDSEVGKGTTFLIYLPRANEEEEEEEALDVHEEKARDLTGTENILLVEDEDAVRTFSERALSNKGYTVISADSGESALETYQNQGEGALDLLITDVVMPGMDGPTLAQRIRQDNPHLKIIFISGYTEDKLKDYMGENIYFLPKPFTLKKLAEKVKEVLED